MKLFVFINLIISLSFAQTKGQSSNELDGLDQYMNHIENFGFSGQVLIEKNNEVIFNKAYGFSNRFLKTEMTKKTPIGIASLSKQFYAAAILKLSDANKLSIHDHISKFFDDVPDDKRNITIHQILTHTSGMYITNDEDYRYLSKEDIKNELFNNKLKFEPGSSWQYSGAYSLLPMIIETVTGLNYRDYIMNELFKPAGMKSSFEGVVKDTIANSYLGFKDNGSLTEDQINYRNYGRGDIIATAEDLYKWIEAIRSEEILSLNSKKLFFEMHHPFDDNNGYGYGWFIHKEDRLVIEHGGDAALGHNGSIFIYPDNELLIIVLSNSRDLEGNYLRHLITGKIEKLILEKSPIDTANIYQNKTLPVPGNFYGSYRLEDQNYIHISNEGAYTWLIPEGTKATSLFLNEKFQSEDWVKGFEKAKQRTQSFLKAAQMKNITELHKTIGGDETSMSSADNYQNGFNELVDALGPLHKYKITGAIPFRDDVFTRANLQFKDGDVNMTFFWSEKGSGRLMGNSNYNKTSFQKGFPVRYDKENNKLIAVDIWRNMQYSFSIEGANLLLDDSKVFEKL